MEAEARVRPFWVQKAKVSLTLLGKCPHRTRCVGALTTALRTGNCDYP
jgi:hypothetical protein